MEKVILIHGTDEDFTIASVDFENQKYRTKLQSFPFNWFILNGIDKDNIYGLGDKALIFKYHVE